MAIDTKDTDWVRQSFMLPANSIDEVDAVRRVFSDASLKFTDTTLGGNFAINPPPQFTRHADLKVRGRFAGSRGMGRYYSEAIDDPAQHIHLRFGVPQFNSLTSFFTSFYDPEASVLARTGRNSGLFYYAGRVAGFLLTLPLQPIIQTGRFYKFLSGNPTSKFYYLKPDMPNYWTAASTLINGIAVNMGIVPKILAKDAEILQQSGGTYGRQDMAYYHEMLPELFHESGGIDLYAVATRAQRLANIQRTKLVQHMEKASNQEDLRNRMKKFQEEMLEDPGSVHMSSLGGKDGNKNARGMEAYLNAWKAQQAATPPGKVDDVEKEGSKSWFSSISEFMLAEARDGSQFVTFKVDYTGTASESFSSSARESDIAGAINSMSSSSFGARFNFADGNIGDDAVSGVLETIAATAMNTAMGIADGIGVSGLAALAGRALVDIPKQWESSQFSPTRHEFTIQLRSPYGNKMSRFLNLMVPLGMILAGALPRSTGKQSYTHPFLCELYSKGRGQIRLGIIDSLSVTRGVGNMGWTPDGEPLGIDVTFSVLDFSTVMHMPLAASPGILDDDTAYTDYLATLGSLGLSDLIYPTHKLRLNMTRFITNLKTWTSPARQANWFMGTAPARLISTIALTTSRE